MTIPKFAELIHTEQVEFPGFPRDPRIPDDSIDEPGDIDQPGDADEPRDHPAFPIGNDNQLLYSYDGALGGKTGYTDDARQTFVAGAERDGRRLAVTLLAADVLPIRPWEQAARLLDYGFALDTDQSVGVLVSPAATTGDTPTTPGWTDRATLAAPPPDTQARAVPAAGDSDQELVRDRVRARRVRRRLVARDRRRTTGAPPPLRQARSSMPGPASASERRRRSPDKPRAASAPAPTSATDPATVGPECT